MTVKEVMERLAAYPSDMTVWAEGCDCESEMKGVQVRQVRVHQDGRPVTVDYLLLTIKA